MDPGFTKAYCVLSNLFWNKKMYEEALAKLKEAEAFRDKGMFKEAESVYKELALLQNDYPNLYNDLGDIYANFGKRKEAGISYQKEIAMIIVHIFNARIKKF